MFKWLKSSWTPFFLTLLLGTALNVEAARNLIADLLWLKPSSLPSSGKDGQLRVDSGDNNKLKKYNEASGQWEEISGSGAGGGGGVNLLVASNFNFEDNPSSISPWTISGSGTFVVESNAGDVGFDDLSGSCDLDAVDAKCLSEAIAVPNGLKGQSCMLEIPYKWSAGTQDHVTFRVEDGSGNAKSQDLNPTPNTAWNTARIFFTCPESGSVQAAVVGLNASATELHLDNVYLGSNKNLFNLSQAEMFGTATWTPVANCAWSGNASVYSSYAVDADCNDPVVTGGVEAPDTKIPAIKIPTMEPGFYKITARGPFYQDDGSNNSECQMRLNEVGTGRFGAVTTLIDTGAAASGVYANTVSGFMEVTDTKTDVVIEIQKRVSSGLANCQVRPISTTAEFYLTFEVEKYPTEQQTAIITEGQTLHYARMHTHQAFDMREDQSNAADGDIPEDTDGAGADVTLYAGNTFDVGILCKDDNSDPDGGLSCNTAASNELGGIRIPSVPKTAEYRVCTRGTRSSRGASGQIASSAAMSVNLGTVANDLNGTSTDITFLDSCMTRSGQSQGSCGQNWAHVKQFTERDTRYQTQSICQTFSWEAGDEISLAIAQHRTADLSTFYEFNTWNAGAVWEIWEIKKSPSQLVSVDIGKFQTKILVTDLTTNAEATELRFDNLIVGKVYRQDCQFSIRNNFAVADPGINIVIFNNTTGSSNPIGRVEVNHPDTNNTNWLTEYGWTSGPFTAVSTQTRVVAGGAGPNSFLDATGDKQRTFCTLTELTGYRETTEF